MISQQLYKLSTKSYFTAIKAAAHFSEKAQRWVDGRKDIFIKLRSAFQQMNGKKTAWFHCASLGEFEQCRTIIEKIKKDHPELKILLTFFSPSGYETRKDYPHADWVFYLPEDSPENAAKFTEIIKPVFAVFVKYEFWYFYLKELKSRSIPTYLIAAIFRGEQPFFQWYGNLHREMLRCFKKIFVQDGTSVFLLKNHDINNVELAGDPRIDRVLEIAAEKRDFPLIEDFCLKNKALVAGSTWKQEELILSKWISKKENSHWKLVVAPHDISPERIREVKKIFSEKAILYSELKNKKTEKNILIIDNIGMLAWLYKYGKIAVVGGGFGTGIHNTLEPMAFGLPVLFGPKYRKFREAVEMQKKGGHLVFTNEKEFREAIKWLTDPNNYQKATYHVSNFMEENRGSTELIIKALKKHF